VDGDAIRSSTAISKVRPRAVPATGSAVAECMLSPVEELFMGWVAARAMAATKTADGKDSSIGSVTLA
jgi:hypothetical protein